MVVVLFASCFCVFFFSFCASSAREEGDREEHRASTSTTNAAGNFFFPVCNHHASGEEENDDESAVKKEIPLLAGPCQFTSERRMKGAAVGRLLRVLDMTNEVEERVEAQLGRAVLELRSAGYSERVLAGGGAVRETHELTVWLAEQVRHAHSFRL